MKWVLIITIFSFKGAEVQTIDVATQQACIVAGNAYLRETQEALNSRQLSVRTLCIPKEEK